ncbi:helix-turn-helix domain-containing protein [Kitasatospora arboriphila]
MFGEQVREQAIGDRPSWVGSPPFVPASRRSTVKDRLGTLLRRQRDLAGLTQEQLAERSGVSVRTIRGWRAGGPRTTGSGR